MPSQTPTHARPAAAALNQLREPAATPENPQTLEPAPPDPADL